MYRIGINGYGRIGQCVLRACYERGFRNWMQIVAINELANIDVLAYLTRYDTTHGRFPKDVAVQGGQLVVGDDTVYVSHYATPELLEWEDLGIDLLLECSGSFSERSIAERYLASGVKKLLFSQPARSDVDATVVYGVNQHLLAHDHRIVSSASCTTNCIVPVIKTLHDAFGVEYGSMTTIHSAMNDQPVIDAFHHSDLRLTRSALQSIIPVDTQLAKGIDRLLPELQGRFKASSVRVPTPNVSCIDLTVHLNKQTTETAINDLFHQTASGSLSGIVGVSQEPHASVDFNHDSRSCIVDATQTHVSGGRLAKLLCWFDNEWGFSNRMLDTALYWLDQTP